MLYSFIGGVVMFTRQVNEAIYLRMLSARDADDLFSLTDRSRDYLQKWLSWLEGTTSVEDSLQYIKHTFYAYNNRQGVHAGIFYHEELVGVVAFHRLDYTNRIGTIGYWLGEEFQGKGIMTDAVASIVTYGFEDLRLNRIEIRVAPENTASRAIPERLRFTKEGRLRQAERLYDTYVDHIIYSMLAEEWSVK